MRYRLTATSCQAVEVDHATRIPEKSIYNSNEDVIYRCEAGYVWDGLDSLTRTCQDGKWSDSKPTCIGKQHISRNSSTIFFLISAHGIISAQSARLIIIVGTHAFVGNIHQIREWYNYCFG